MEDLKLKKLSPEETWDLFVGEQTPREFMELSEWEGIEPSVEEYVQDEIFESNFGHYSQEDKKIIMEKLAEYIYNSNL